MKTKWLDSEDEGDIAYRALALEHGDQVVALNMILGLAFNPSITGGGGAIKIYAEDKLEQLAAKVGEARCAFSGTELALGGEVRDDPSQVR